MHRLYSTIVPGLYYGAHFADLINTFRAERYVQGAASPIVAA